MIYDVMSGLLHSRVFPINFFTKFLSSVYTFVQIGKDLVDVFISCCLCFSLCSNIELTVLLISIVFDGIPSQSSILIDDVWQ